MREVGEKLQARARELGLTDAEVARRLGLAQGRYSNYVNGAREPDFATLARICRELAISPDELLGFRSPGDDSSSDTRTRIDALLDGFTKQKLELAHGLLTVVARSSDVESSSSGGSTVIRTRPKRSKAT